MGLESVGNHHRGAGLETKTEIDGAGADTCSLGCLRQPRRSRRFFEEYPDRIMFGTDASPNGTSTPQQDLEPKMFQLYYHKDKGLTNSMIERCKDAKYDALALTVDTIVGGKRERDLVTGFTSPPRLTPRSLFSFAAHPHWTLNYLLREKFDLPNISSVIEAGSKQRYSVMDYLDTQLKRTIDWDDAARLREEWGGPFAVKGVMSVDDAKRCVDIGATAIMISNHGGRQLDGSRSPFDQLSAIADAVGGEIELIVDGGVRRGDLRVGGLEET